MGKEYQLVESNKHLEVLHPMIVANRFNLVGVAAQPQVISEHGRDFSMDKFELYVNENINEICDQLNTRWLISICDTYVISGTERQSLIALNIVQMVNHCKFFFSYLGDRKDAPDWQWGGELWDGVITFNIRQIHLEDTFKNSFSRARDRIAKEPALLRIYDIIIERMKSSELFENYRKFL